MCLSRFVAAAGATVAAARLVTRERLIDPTVFGTVFAPEGASAP